MKTKYIIWILIISIVLSMSGCSKQNTEKTRYEAQFLELFDTVTKIVGYAKDKEEFTEYAQKIHDNLEIYHQLYDIYNDYDGINNIKTINDNAGIQPVKVDQRIIDLIKFSEQAYELTDSKVNIAFGAVLKVWHDYRTEGIDDPENAKIPPMELLKEKAKHTDITKIIVDEAASTVYLEDPEMRLDVGAIAKGYATEMVSRIMMDEGYTNGMLSVGGNVRTIGAKDENENPWNVGIQNPDLKSENSNLYILGLSNLSLVTSGDYERFYTVDGKRYHHIIDPVTLMPANYFTAVSIVCENSGMADALSTAVYNMPFEQGFKLIESLDGIEALWVFQNGDMKYSSNFEALIRK